MTADLRRDEEEPLLLSEDNDEEPLEELLGTP